MSNRIGARAVPSHGVPFPDAVRFWLKLGFINFGGPTGQIAIMHDELVTKRRWIGEDRFLHALSYCMLLPGPEAQQLAIYVGWLLHGTPGGIVAGVLFVLPAAVLMVGLAYVYAVHGDLTWVASIVDGLSAAVVGIVFAATIVIARRALRSGLMAGIAIVVFAGIYAFGAPFPVVVLAAGVSGLVLVTWRPAWFPNASTDEDDAALSDAAAASSARGGAARTGRVLMIGLALWWGPLALVSWIAGGGVISREALFFGQVAVITFGGAYAVLAYLAQEVTQRFGLAAADVVAGLGLAESTPGPLIMVTQFLGFLAAYRNPGDLPPVVAGVVGSAVTLWATFAPSFLWIFLGAPYVERVREHRRLRAGLTTITAAVVGVIASLGVTFAVQVLFREAWVSYPFGHAVAVPVARSVDGLHVAIAAVAFLGLWRYRWNVVWIVLGSAATGLLWTATTT
jgi:chromate transporter